MDVRKDDRRNWKTRFESTMNHQRRKRPMEFNGKNGKYNKPHNFNDGTRDLQSKEDRRSGVSRDFNHVGTTRHEFNNTLMHSNGSRLGGDDRLESRWLTEHNGRGNSGRRNPHFDKGNEKSYTRNGTRDEKRGIKNEQNWQYRRDKQNTEFNLFKREGDYQEQGEYRNTRFTGCQNRDRQDREEISHSFNRPWQLDIERHGQAKDYQRDNFAERDSFNTLCGGRYQEKNLDAETAFGEVLSQKMLPDRHEEIKQGECEFSPVSSETIEEYSIEDKVSILLNIILENGGEIEIEELQKDCFETFGQIIDEDKGDLKTFLEDYPKVFEFDTETVEEAEEGESPEETGRVRAKTEATLCQAHSNDPKSCNGGCNALHICKFYILSSCEMNKCKFIHDFDNEHNKKVKRKFYLHRVELPNICRLLQHDANRCRVTVPVICRYYNTDRGCRSGDSGRNQQSPRKCPFLHLCSNYVDGKCCAAFCRQNHRLLEGHVLEILVKYNLDPREWNQGETRIMSLLRWSSNDFKENNKNRYIPYKVKKGYNDLSNEKLWRKRKLFGEEPNVSLAVKMPKMSDVISFSTDDECPIDNPSCSWSISGGNVNEDIPDDIGKDLEDKHTKYLLAKTATVNFKGKSFTVDFETLKGRFDASTSEVKIHRNVFNKKYSDEKVRTPSNHSKTTTSEDGYSSTSTDESVCNDPFEKVKEAKFIKI